MICLLKGDSIHDSQKNGGGAGLIFAPKRVNLCLEIWGPRRDDPFAWLVIHHLTLTHHAEGAKPLFFYSQCTRGRSTPNKLSMIPNSSSSVFLSHCPTWLRPWRGPAVMCRGMDPVFCLGERVYASHSGPSFTVLQLHITDCSML